MSFYDHSDEPFGNIITRDFMNSQITIICLQNTLQWKQFNLYTLCQLFSLYVVPIMWKK